MTDAEKDALRFFQAARSPFAVLNEDGTVDAINGAFTELALDGANASGKPFSALLHRRDRTRVDQALGRLQRGAETSFDAQIEGRSNHRSVRFSATRDAGGGLFVAGVLAPLGRAEDAHRLAVLDSVLSSAPILLWSLDSEGNFSAWEGKGVERLGTEPGALVGKSCLTHWKDSEAFPHVLRALAGEEFSTRLTLPGPLHYDAWYLPLKDESGKPNGMVGFALEVTAQREAESSLRDKLGIIEKQNATLDLFGRVLETAPIILWSIDRDGNSLGGQGKGMELMNLPPEALDGLNVFEMYKDQPDIVNGIVRALAGEETRGITTPLPNLHFENWYMPLRHKDGDVYGMMALSIDCSERVRNEKELREKLELIERQSATIRALATPIIQVWDEVLCLPVIGTVDSARTADMMQSLLEAIVREQARYAIVDLTGVEVVDTSTADHLIQLFRAAKVLGVDGILCGIRPAVAQTVVALGLELGSVRTMRSLRDALKWCIRVRSAEKTNRVGSTGAPSHSNGAQ